MPVPARVFEDRPDIVAKLDAHQGGCRMPIPVSGSEVWIALGKPLQGVEERPGLVGFEGFRIAVSNDGIGIGRNAAEGQSLTEMRDPCVQAAQGGRDSVAGLEQGEYPALRYAVFETAYEPPRAEIFGNDTVDRREPVFAFGPEQAGSSSIVGGVAVEKFSKLGDVQEPFRRFPGRTGVHTRTVNTVIVPRRPPRRLAAVHLRSSGHGKPRGGGDWVHRA